MAVPLPTQFRDFSEWPMTTKLTQPGRAAAPGGSSAGWQTAASAVFAALAAASVPCRATGFDLTADWSDTQNPNGVWSCNEGPHPLPHVAFWESSFGNWSVGQPGWAKSENGNNRIPFWFRVTGTPNFTHDWQAGDVVVHTPDNFNGVGNGTANVT